MLMLASCGGDDAGGATEEFPGRLSVQLVGGGELFTVSARATVCPRDSIVALAGVGDRWAGALSIRTVWPATAGRHPVRRTRDSAGVALVALRPLGSANDSSWTAVDGTLQQSGGGGSVAGSFEATMLRGAADTMRVSGTFEAPAPARACP